MRVAIGIDLGGTNIKAGLVRESDGEVLVRFGIPTKAHEGREGVLFRLLELTRKALDSPALTKAMASGAEVAGVGIGTPGAIDSARGYVFRADNIPGWSGTDIAGRFRQEFDFPVKVHNDANVYAFGEYMFGAGRGAGVLLAFTLGTGIGGGIVIGGKIFEGASGFAAEFGHMPLEAGGRQCTCGGQGCLEAYASATAIVKIAREAIENGADTSLPKKGRALEKLTAAKIHEVAVDGDELSRKIIREAAEMLGRGVATVMNCFDPDVVVLGGGVAAMGDMLFDPVREFVEDRVFFAKYTDYKIVPATLGSDAGVIGAAGLVFSEG
jgi:glucokinase